MGRVMLICNRYDCSRGKAGHRSHLKTLEADTGQEKQEMR